MMSDLYRTRLAGLVKAQTLARIGHRRGRAPRAARQVRPGSVRSHPYADESLPPYVATPPKRAPGPPGRGGNDRAAQEWPPVPYAAPKNPAPRPGTRRRIALIGPLADSPSTCSARGRRRRPGSGRRDLAHRPAGSGATAATTKLLYASGTDILTDSDAASPPHLAARSRPTWWSSPGRIRGAHDRRIHLPHAARSARQPGGAARSRSPRSASPPCSSSSTAARSQSSGRRARARHLEAWYPGIEAGPAVADILFGDANPSGKLTATFPRAVGQEPLFYNQLPTGRPADDIDLTHPPTDGQDKYFSRYIDETNAPLYPFGYGLSYTQFTYSKVSLSVKSHLLPKTCFIPPISVSSPRRKTCMSRRTSRTWGPSPAPKSRSSTSATPAAASRSRCANCGASSASAFSPARSKHLDFTLGFNELTYYNLEMEQRDRADRNTRCGSAEASVRPVAPHSRSRPRTHGRKFAG